MEITISGCSKNDLMQIDGLYLPDLDRFIKKSYFVGRCSETGQPMFFIVDGLYQSKRQFNKIRLTVIIKKEYEQIGAENIYDTGSTVDVNGYRVAAYADGFDAPFYRYFLDFELGSARYYTDYYSVQENDHIDFLLKFLKA